MIAGIRTALTSLGYKVHETRQEKIGTKELVVVLDDVDVRIETNMTYKAYVWVVIEWDTNKPDNIVTDIVTLVDSLESNIIGTSTLDNKATFKFIQSEINQLGLMYRVSITVEYVEEINLGY